MKRYLFIYLCSLSFLAAGAGDTDLGKWLGLGAVTFATINVVGGYMVTDRMLGMFKSKSEGGK